MSEFNIELAGGASVRLPTAGKYCDRDIIVTAAGGDGSDLVKDFVERKITTFNNSDITNVGPYAFASCASLTGVNLPAATSLGGYAFVGCKLLESANLPLAASSNSNVFQNCSALNTVNLPLLKTTGSSFFYNCTSLAYVDLPKVYSIASNAFSLCSQLSNLFLRYTTNTVTLQNINAFSSSPFAADGVGGHVFVPRALIETYQTATNWATLYAAGTCTFLAIEDYTVDGTITGALDWDKINAEV